MVASSFSLNVDDLKTVQPHYHSFLDFDDLFGSGLPGIIVPQRVFETRANYNAHPTIRFSVGGRPGVRLRDAAGSVPIRNLDNRTMTPVISNTSARTTLRLMVRAMAV